MTSPLLVQEQFRAFCSEIHGNIKALLLQLNTEFEQRACEFLEQQSSAFDAYLHDAHGETLRSLQQEREQIRQDRAALLREQEELQERMKCMDLTRRVKLDVGGYRYTTTIETLRRHPDSVLALMFSGRLPVPVDEDGRYFIDRNGEYFGFLLDFLRDGEVLVPEELQPAVEHEALFYHVPVQFAVPKVRPRAAASQASSSAAAASQPPPPFVPSSSLQTGLPQMVPITSQEDPQAVYAAPNSERIEWIYPPDLLNRDPSLPAPIPHYVDISVPENSVTARYDNICATVPSRCSLTHGVHEMCLTLSNYKRGEIGIGTVSGTLQPRIMLGTSRVTSASESCCLHSSGYIIYNGERALYSDPLCENDVVTVILDLNSGTLSFKRNGTNLGVAFDASDVQMLRSTNTSRAGPASNNRGDRRGIHFAVSVLGKGTQLILTDQKSYYVT